MPSRISLFIKTNCELQTTLFSIEQHLSACRNEVVNQFVAKFFLPATDRENLNLSGTWGVRSLVDTMVLSIVPAWPACVTITRAQSQAKQGACPCQSCPPSPSRQLKSPPKLYQPSTIHLLNHLWYDSLQQEPICCFTATEFASLTLTPLAEYFSFPVGLLCALHSLLLLSFHLVNTLPVQSLKCRKEGGYIPATLQLARNSFAQGRIEVWYVWISSLPVFSCSVPAQLLAVRHLSYFTWAKCLPHIEAVTWNY